MEYIEIGSTPPEEDCAQVGSDGYHDRAKVECRAYIEALRKHLGEEPPGARLKVKGSSHEFGTYYEVACYYDDEDEAATNYAFKCESDGPATWAEVGMTAPVEQVQS